MGKGTYDLCESFVVYNTYMDRARAAVRTHGDVSFSQGGSFYDVIYCLKNYGMVPQEAMAAQGSLYGDSLYNHNELDAVTTAYVGAIAKNTGLKNLLRAGLTAWPAFTMPIWANCPRPSR